MKFGLIVRSYAPFDTFGGGFHGDNRGPTTASNVTSRVKAWVTFDPMTGKVDKPEAKSDESRHPWFQPKVGVPTARVDSTRLGPGWIHFRLSFAGANPITPRSVSPTIDTSVALTAAIGKGHLNINAELKGDQFPSSEVILEDHNGGRRMLQSHETDGGRDTGPFARLWGDRQGAMSAICASFPISEDGIFL